MLFIINPQWVAILFVHCLHSNYKKMLQLALHLPVWAGSRKILSWAPEQGRHRRGEECVRWPQVKQQGWRRVRSAGMRGRWSGSPGCGRGCSLEQASPAPLPRTSAGIHPGQSWMWTKKITISKRDSTLTLLLQLKRKTSLGCRSNRHPLFKFSRLSNLNFPFGIKENQNNTPTHIYNP